MDNSSEWRYAKIIVVMMMTYIENSYLANQLSRDGNAHVHGLDVLDCVGSFEMNGVRVRVSVALVVFRVCCVFALGLDIRMAKNHAQRHVSGNSPGYNMQTGGHK